MVLHKLKTMLGLEPTCEEVNGFLVRYLDGALDEKTKRKFLMHIGDCPACDRFLKQYEATVQLAHEAGQVKPPEELVEKTLNFLRDHWTSQRSDS